MGAASHFLLARMSYTPFTW